MLCLYNKNKLGCNKKMSLTHTIFSYLARHQIGCSGKKQGFFIWVIMFLIRLNHIVCVYSICILASYIVTWYLHFVVIHQGQTLNLKHEEEGVENNLRNCEVGPSSKPESQDVSDKVGLEIVFILCFRHGLEVRIYLGLGVAVNCLEP